MPLKAGLQGHSFDLHLLAELFPVPGDPAVGVDEHGYFLTGEALADDLLDDGGAMVDAAATLLKRVNGAARLQSAGYRTVQLSNTFTGPAGQQHLVVQPDCCEGRVHVFSPTLDGGTSAAPPLPARSHVQVAKQHPDVAEALAIIGAPEPRPSWSDLYKILEIVRDNIGSDLPSKKDRWKRLLAAGFAEPQDIDDVTANSCDPRATGDEARHARWGGTEPGRILTLHGGREIVGNLVVAWLDATT